MQVVSDNSSVKLPILSTFFATVLVFAGCGYVGFEAAGYISYRCKESVSFASLGPEEARQFRQVTQSLWGCASSGVVGVAVPKLIPQQISYLQSLRATAPEDVRPILDLQIATDHAVLARFDEQSGKPADGATHREAARSFLRSLGWKDVSDGVLNDVAERALSLSSEFPL